MHNPIRKCPYCDTDCWAEWCDVGVGWVQIGPYHCIGCGASEIGPNDAPRELTKEESDTEWYGPNSEPGSSANVIGGKIASSEDVKAAYRDKFVGNPEWNDKDYVDDWYARLRTDGLPNEELL